MGKERGVTCNKWSSQLDIETGDLMLKGIWTSALCDLWRIINFSLLDLFGTCPCMEVITALFLRWQAFTIKKE